MKTTLRTIVSAAAAVLLFSPFAGAWTDCDPCAPITCDPCAAVGCTPKTSKWKVGGWIEMSYYRNAWGQENVYTPNDFMGRNLVTLDSGNSNMLGRNKNADFQGNQIWGYIQREMDSRHGFDWGFRADAAYGTDMHLGQAHGDHTWDWNWGEGDYYGSIPRLYAEVGYRNLGVKFGRFDSLLGLETLDAPENFFITRSQSFGCTPIFTTGILANYKLGNRATVYFGWINGNDNGFEQRFGDSMITGGVDFALTKKIDLAYMFTVGYEYNGDYQGADGTRWWRDSTAITLWGGDRHDVFMQSITMKWRINKRWTYMLEGWYQQSEFANEVFYLEFCPNKAGIVKQYGINNHLIYKINKKWDLGYRFEWHIAEENTTDFDNVRRGVNIDVYTHTLALRWKALKHLTLTGEIHYIQMFGNDHDLTHRFDEVNGDGQNHQFSGGVSAIVHY